MHQESLKHILEAHMQEYSNRGNNAGMNQAQKGRRTRKHVPNTIQAVPKAEEAKLDHAKLDERLKAYGMKEKKVLGDGKWLQI